MSLSSPPVGPQSADFDHEAGESVLHHAPAIFNRASLHVNIGKRLIKTPKLYFYDTGLLCYLLGIRSPGQLELHPLRGAIFESWVASEILKVYANRGETPLMFFYRDRSGTEVDFVIDRGSKILTVEVKAGRTPYAGYFSALEQLRQNLESARANLAKPVQAVVVYGGEESQKRNQGELLSWHSVDAFPWAGN
jgi:predicted AAA+ superfamily ATPase